MDENKATKKKLEQCVMFEKDTKYYSKRYLNHNVFKDDQSQLNSSDNVKLQYVNNVKI